MYKDLSYMEYLKASNEKDSRRAWINWKIYSCGMSEKEATIAGYDKVWGWSPNLLSGSEQGNGIRCGYVINGELAGKFWEIQTIANEHYVLRIGGDFYTSSDSQRALIDELTALDGIRR